jgi:hypothetical protein
MAYYFVVYDDRRGSVLQKNLGSGRAAIGATPVAIVPMIQPMELGMASGSVGSS